MKLSLITLNYNNARSTIELLDSLRQQHDQDFGVVVVDNASDDAVLLEQYYMLPRWNLILNRNNLGFSGGNNMGIQRALSQGSDWILLINNDTHVEPDFIARLKGQLENKRGIVGIPLEEGDRVAHGGCITWLAHTLQHVYEPIKVSGKNYAIGAGLVISREALETIGLLDERYFLYFEDADYSARALKKEVGISFLSEPSITHHISQTTKKLGTPLLLRYHYRNMFLFNSLHAPWYIKGILPIWAFLGIIKQLIKLLILPEQRPESKAIFGGILDYFFRQFGQIREHRS